MDQPEPKKRRLEGMSVEDRLRRSRERNREHARRTRQRKKAQLQTLQSRVAELQEEGRRLGKLLKIARRRTFCWAEQPAWRVPFLIYSRAGRTRRAKAMSDNV